MATCHWDSHVATLPWDSVGNYKPILLTGREWKKMSTEPTGIAMEPMAEQRPAIARRDDGSYVLSMSTLLRRNQEDVFAFLSDAANVERITPSWVKYRIVTPMPVEMREGALFDYAMRIRCFRLKWRTEITEWSPPYSFADTQARGPFTEWRDRHVFTQVDAQTTVVRNEVVYRVPGGAPIHRLLVRRDLLRIYRHEQRMVHKLLEGEADIQSGQ